MLSSVVDQCLSMALASATRRVSTITAPGRSRRHPWQAPLAAYPRLAAALQRAEAEGLVSRARGSQLTH